MADPSVTKIVSYTVRGGALNAVSTTKVTGYIVGVVALNAQVVSKFAGYAVIVTPAFTGDQVQRYNVNG